MKMPPERFANRTAGNQGMTFSNRNIKICEVSRGKDNHGNPSREWDCCEFLASCQVDTGSLQMERAVIVIWLFSVSLRIGVLGNKSRRAKCRIE